ncbi:MAG: helix-turn-helix transcriptional regulator [Rhizobiaceae bacterium]|nr:helix-turn-helix transcriptional regulator [Rhizobiaceae bacterium]
MVSEVPRDENFKLHEMLIVSNWDPEIIREFDISYETVFRDLFDDLRGSVSPIHLDLPVSVRETKQPEEKDHAPMQLAECVFFPVYERSGKKGMVGFSCPKPHDPDMFAKLGFLSSFVFDKSMEIKKVTTTQNNALSEREIQCLNWTAAGKTSYEIGIILDISLNTVNHYLNNASKKLNCVNRTHAVAKCVQEGIIEF